MYVSTHTMSLQAEQISIKEFSINHISFYDQETIVRFFIFSICCWELEFVILQSVGLQSWFSFGIFCSFVALVWKFYPTWH